MPASLVDEVKRARAAIAELPGLQALRGSCSTPPWIRRAVRRAVLDQWLQAAERKAGLVAAADGWKDVGMLLTCSTAADDETVLAVMSEGRKVRDARAAK